MKKSEIKDLYNQSDAALMRLKYITLLLPYSTDQVIAKNTMEAAAMAAELWKPVKVMCDYMIDDGSTDMTERLLNIKAEVVNIQKSVLKMAIADSDEAFELIQNCQAIKNTIKDMEEWTANDVKPQQTTPEAPQQPSEGNSGELADDDNNTQPQGAKKRVKDFKIDCILVDDKEKYLEVLHKQIDGEKSADVIIAKIKGAMSNGRILKPSYQALINEFPNIKIIVPKSTFYEKMK